MAPSSPISFARGAPAPELIPSAELADCAHAVAKRDGARIFAYGPGGGYEPLREWVAGRHGVEPGRIVLTVGGLHGFVLYLAEALARRPGRVLVEGPSYDRPLKILARESVETIALEMDEEGLDPDSLERELQRTTEPPAFLYTIPTFQNPSGRTLSAERRVRIAELAERHALPVLEDDPYGLVRYEGEPVTSLHELMSSELVTHTSSFSKTVAPGLRTGYFVLPAADARSFEERAVSTYISPPYLTQATIAELIERGRFEPNLESVKAQLQVRRDAMLEALERALPPGSTWGRPEGGYFVWLDLPDGTSASELAIRAAECGVAVIRGSDFFPPDSGHGDSSVRLAFSYETPERIAEGVSVLAGLLR
ncbi:MAG: PLP-dependent aminotransferase family protein [Actinomycetota bacterium]|nr:PLP-dependent aminotransferase family protein [Actinomycetota bacterium]